MFAGYRSNSFDVQFAVLHVHIHRAAGVIIYGYRPSLALGIIGAVYFGIMTLVALALIVKLRHEEPFLDFAHVEPKNVQPLGSSGLAPSDMIHSPAKQYLYGFLLPFQLPTSIRHLLVF